MYCVCFMLWFHRPGCSLCRIHFDLLFIFTYSLLILEIVLDVRFPFWPYTKGVITVLLVIPYFSGAFYVYRQFIRSHISESPLVWKWNIFSVDSIPRGENLIASEKEDLVNVVAKNIFEVEDEPERHILYQVGFYSCLPICVLIFYRLICIS